MMKLTKFFKALSVTAATIGILLPYPLTVNAADIVTATRQAETVRDVALGAGSVLRGQVVNTEGLGERGATVAVVQRGETLATVKTDANGAFAIAGMPAGICQISSGKAAGVVRAWSPGTAPPVASEGVLLAPAELTARGKGVVSNHWCKILLVGATGVIGGVIGYNIRDCSPAS